MPNTKKLVLLGLGFGCLVAYSRMASLGFVGYLSGGFVQSVDSWYVLRSIFGLATLAFLAFSGATKRFSIELPALLITTAAAIASVILFAVDSYGSYGIVVAVLGGCAASILMYAWLLTLCRLKISSIVVVSSIGLIISGLIIMGVPLIDSSLGLVMTIAAAFFAGISLVVHDSRLSACLSDGLPTPEDLKRLPWLSIVSITVCGFAATVIYGIAKHLTWLYDWSPNYPLFGGSALLVIIITFAMMIKAENWKRIIWVPQLMVLLLALAASCFSVREVIQAAVGLMLASVFCSHFLHWPVFSAILAEADAPRSFLAALLLIATNGSLAAIEGEALGGMLPHSMQNLGGVAGITIIALVSVFVLVFFVCRHFGLDKDMFGASLKQGFATGNNAHDGALDPAAILQDRIAQYAEEYGLTPRESEVAMMTVQGFTCAYIAEKLVVSNSTVRFHQQNVYKKLNVHSQNELIEMVALPAD